MAPYFVDYVNRLAESQFDTSGNNQRIYTTIDLELQQAAEQALASLSSVAASAFVPISARAASSTRSTVGATAPRATRAALTTPSSSSAKLTPAPCNIVKVPRVAEAPCALECKLLRFLELESLEGKPVPATLVFGQIVGIHVDDRFIKNGRLDTAAMKPLARLGYNEYAYVEEVFAMERPPYPPTKNHY